MPKFTNNLSKKKIRFKLQTESNKQKKKEKMVQKLFSILQMITSKAILLSSNYFSTIFYQVLDGKTYYVFKGI